MKYRNVLIEPCLNGFLVRVGCQTAVFNEWKDMISALKLYYENPKATEEQFLESSRVFHEANVAVDPMTYQNACIERQTAVTQPLGVLGTGIGGLR